ncbi:MAG: Methyltransferase type 11, partial [Bryobacterales bacterium]|nr:Methyltransferase type 11 [Bryobacterales bacterium]
AVDIAPTFIRYARAAEKDATAAIRYFVASALHLPFSSATFDFATAFMSFMDLPHPEIALAEAFRILKPGGFLQFSITHPCFDTPYRELLRDPDGKAYAVAVGRYFDESEPQLQEWLFSAAPPEAKAGLQPFRTLNFHHQLSIWFNFIVDAGFSIERVAEPFADEEAVRRYPSVE